MITASNGESSVVTSLPREECDGAVKYYDNQFFIPDIDGSWNIEIAMMEDDSFFDDELVFFSGGGSELLSSYASGEFAKWARGLNRGGHLGFCLARSFRSTPDMCNDISGHVSQNKISEGFRTAFPIHCDWGPDEPSASAPVFAKENESAFHSAGTFASLLDTGRSQLLTNAIIAAVRPTDRPWVVEFYGYKTDGDFKNLHVSILLEVDGRNATAFWVHSADEDEAPAGASYGGGLTSDSFTVSEPNLNCCPHMFNIKFTEIVSWRSDDNAEHTWDMSGNFLDCISSYTSALLFTYTCTLADGHVEVKLKVTPSDEYWFYYENDDFNYDDVTSVVHTPFYFFGDNETIGIDFAAHPYVSGYAHSLPNARCTDAYYYYVFEFLSESSAENIDFMNAEYQRRFGRYLLVMVPTAAEAFIMRAWEAKAIQMSIRHVGQTRSTVLRQRTDTFSQYDTLISDLDMAGAEGRSTASFNRFVLNPGTDPLVLRTTTEDGSSYRTAINDYTSYSFPENTTTASFGPTRHGYFTLNTTNDNLSGWMLVSEDSTEFDGTLYSLSNTFYSSDAPLHVAAVCDSYSYSDYYMLMYDHCVFDHAAARGLIVMNSPISLSTSESVTVCDKVGANFGSAWTDSQAWAEYEPLDDLVRDGHLLTVSYYDYNYYLLTLYVSTETEEAIQIPLRNFVADVACAESAFGITEVLDSNSYVYLGDGTVLIDSSLDIDWNGAEFCIFPENTGISWEDELKGINIEISNIEPSIYRNLYVKFLDADKHIVILAGTEFTVTFWTDQDELTGDFYLCADSDNCAEIDVAVSSSEFSFRTTNDIELDCYTTIALFLQCRENGFPVNLELSVLEGDSEYSLIASWSQNFVFGNENLQELFFVDYSDVNYTIEIFIDGSASDFTVYDLEFMDYKVYGIERSLPSTSFDATLRLTEEWGSLQSKTAIFEPFGNEFRIAAAEDTIDMKFMPNDYFLVIYLELDLFFADHTGDDEIEALICYQSLETADNSFCHFRYLTNTTNTIEGYLEEEEVIDYGVEWMFEEQHEIVVKLPGYSQRVAIASPAPVSVTELPPAEGYVLRLNDTYDIAFDLCVQNWGPNWVPTAILSRCINEECEKIREFLKLDTCHTVEDLATLSSWTSPEEIEYVLYLSYRYAWEANDAEHSDLFTAYSLVLTPASVSISLDGEQTFYFGEPPSIQFTAESNVDDWSILPCTLLDGRDGSLLELSVGQHFEAELSNITSVALFDIEISCEVGEEDDYRQIFEISSITCSAGEALFDDVCHRCSVSASYSVDYLKENSERIVSGSVVPAFEGLCEAYPLTVSLASDEVTVECDRFGAVSSNEMVEIKCVWDFDAIDPLDAAWQLLLESSIGAYTASWTSDEIQFESAGLSSGVLIGIIAAGGVAAGGVGFIGFKFGKKWVAGKKNKQKLIGEEGSERDAASARYVDGNASENEIEEAQFGTEFDLN
eukprot:gnl/Chilomastix_cuspidata/4508.p1 GENE.gnl/Chilomastix_cuspidata/4508~~gnl/Chilomastix_cuspidata/4508.p1  ORF type:complete len:1459 (+),score=300.22 gnl/Chilomastix_cuspidata/4508:1423-5799(+)